MKLPALTAYAKAQAFGMAVGFALALYVVNQADWPLGPFALGAVGAWLGFEFTLGPREPSHLTDAATLFRALAIGFALPWAGALIAYALHALRP